MANFLKLLHKLARDIHKQKRKYLFFKEDRRSLDKSQATQCWICEKPLSEVKDPENSVDLDPCMYSGKFIGWAQKKCNRPRRNINFITFVGHNTRNHDLHHICLALINSEPTTTVRVIPVTDEKYISLIFVVLIDTFVNKKGQ